MPISRKLLFITTLFFFSLSGHNLCLGHQDDSTETKELVPQLIDAYQHFDYERCSMLLDIAYKNLQTFSDQDLKSIYLYSAFLEYHQGNTIQAAQNFWDILTIDPTYTLDPVTTPPKLLALFQKTKIEYLEDLNKRFMNTEMEQNSSPFPWRALAFPGWEQWHRGHRTKGLILSATGMVTLAGTVVSIIQTSEKEKDYQQATDPDLIKTRYDAYQTAYQRQFYFAYAFIGIWSFSHLDLLIWSQPAVRLTTYPTLDSVNRLYPSANLNIQF